MIKQIMVLCAMITLMVVEVIATAVEWIGTQVREWAEKSSTALQQWGLDDDTQR